MHKISKKGNKYEVRVLTRVSAKLTWVTVGTFNTRDEAKEWLRKEVVANG
jgi:hypothetical protein